MYSQAYIEYTVRNIKDLTGEYRVTVSQIITLQNLV
jgi:hypothetical protein